MLGKVLFAKSHVIFRQTNQKHDARPILKDGVWGSARVLDARKSLKIPGIFCTENCRHFEQFSSVQGTSTLKRGVIVKFLDISIIWAGL